MKKVLVLLVLLFVPLCLSAQLDKKGLNTDKDHLVQFSATDNEKEETDRSLIRVHVGVGTGIPEIFSGVIGASHQSDVNILSLRISNVSDLFGDSKTDFAFLFGRAKTGGGIWSGSDINVIKTLGIPIELQLFATASNIGIGVYGMANLNTEQSFAGITISLQFGRLR